MIGKLKNESGVAMVFVILAMVALIGFAALAIDFGNATSRKSRLQNACDAAALAGAYEWAHDGKDGAVNESQNIFERNITGNISGTVVWTEGEAGQIHASAILSDEDHTITVRARETIDTLLAGIFGRHEMEVNVEAVAIYGPAGTISRGLRPFALSDAIPYAMGDEIDLVADESMLGNFWFLRPDGSGTADLGDAILDGSSLSYSIGDYITPEPGAPENPAGVAVSELIATCTVSSSDSYVDHMDHQDTCPRIVICPLMDFDTYGGGASEQVLITGFASIFLKEVYNGWIINATGEIVTVKPDYLPSEEYKQIKNVISGEFVQTIAEGTVDWELIDYGVYTTDLIK